MSKALLFWLLMLGWLILALWVSWPIGGNYRPLGFNVLLFVLLGLLGWGVFGAAVK